MLSSQGASTHVSGGIMVRQTIGQQSAIGNFRGPNAIVGQGFLQSDTMKTANAPVIVVTTTAYPNPFVDSVNFQFSSSIAGPIKISLFDVMGRLVYYKEKIAINNIVTIENLSFAQ